MNAPLSPHSSVDLQPVFARRVLPGIAALLLFALVAAAGALVLLAHDLDRDAQRQTRFLAGKALQTPHDWMRRSITDYAFWGDAYAHLNRTPDIQWAYAEENLGPSLYRDFGYEAVFVIAPDGHTTYSVIRGELASTEAHTWLSSGLDSLIERAREAVSDEEGATGLLTRNGMPVAAAAAVLTVGGSTVEEMDGEPAVLVFADLLDPARLDELGAGYGIVDLRSDANTEPVTIGQPRVMLETEDGRALAFAWAPPQPGRQLLALTLPLLALVGLGLGILAWLLLRQALRTARLVDQSYRALAASRSALMTSEARFRDVAEAASDWIWETDDALHLTYLSNRFEQITGHHTDDWLGRPLHALLEVEPAALRAWLDDAQAQPLRCRYRSACGDSRDCRLAARRIADDETAAGYRGTASDITEEARAQAHVEHLSQHDALTGLANRNRLRDYLARRLEPRIGESPAVTLLYIDLDRFKPVNDGFGHGVGDRVLTDVAERLRRCTRDGDLVARVGGDEFVMLLDPPPAAEALDGLCRRIIDALNQPFTHAGQRLFIGASIGVARAPQDARSAENLLRCADIALYQAKAEGRGTWRRYAREMDERLLERRLLEDALRVAIADEQFVVHYQPRYLSDGLQLRGAEALVRWAHPAQGLLAPERFITLAEDTGLIVPLGRWVLRQACQEAAAWPDGLTVSVNLSPVQLCHAELVDDVLAALRDSGLPPGRLELEITETGLMNEDCEPFERLRSLKALGIRIAMDDFGTGYSSLNHLRQFRFDAIKIDRSFVAGMPTSAEDQSIVEALIGLGRGLRLEVTAEGVETAEQLTTLTAAGCTEVQGFHMSRPLEVDALRALLESR